MHNDIPYGTRATQYDLDVWVVVTSGDGSGIGRGEGCDAKGDTTATGTRRMGARCVRVAVMEGEDMACEVGGRPSASCGMGGKS